MPGPSNNIRPTDRPTRDDLSYWSEEADSFAFKPANPQASTNSLDYRTWGIPKEKLPPADAVAYVIATYKEGELGERVHDKTDSRFIDLHPMFKWSFISTVMAHFLWFRSPNGAKWIMNLYGVQEVDPFYSSYAYFWADRNSGSTSLLEKPIYNLDRLTNRKKLMRGVELRIFREWERVLDPPCSQQNLAPIAEMKKLMLSHRSPLLQREAHLASDQTFCWVSEVLRDWFLEAQPNREWPTRKADRITGSQWVRQLERGPNTKFFEGLEKVALYKGRAYRLRDTNGGVYWCGGKEIRIVPLKDLYLEHKMMNDAEIDMNFRCTSCEKRKACVPHTGDNKLCCHCYSVQMEYSDRPSLIQCTMDRECKNCPDKIASPQDLVTLKNRLNRPARTGPVPR